MTGTLHGADEATVIEAIDRSRALIGTRGFAGRLEDGRLVRDVLGRYPVYRDGTGDEWSFDPSELSDPQVLAPGSTYDGERERRCWRVPVLPVDTRDAAAIGRIRRAVRSSLDEVDDSGVAVAFSGGVDSGVLASELDAPMYVAGFDDAPDIETAKRGARALDRRVRVVPIDHDRLERAAISVVGATGRCDPMTVAIAAPLFLVAERAADDGFDRLAVGQGVDELFGGYEKVATADHRVAAETTRGATRELIRSLPAQLERDVLSIRAGGVEPIAPLLHDRVVRAALRLDDDQLVRDGTRKFAFRRAASAFLPDTMAEREKTAIQYGSRVARELDRLARRAGFKRRMGDHVTAYLESLTRGTEHG